MKINDTIITSSNKIGKIISIYNIDEITCIDEKSHIFKYYISFCKQLRSEDIIFPSTYDKYLKLFQFHMPIKKGLLND